MAAQKPFGNPSRATPSGEDGVVRTRTDKRETPAAARRRPSGTPSILPAPSPEKHAAASEIHAFGHTPAALVAWGRSLATSELAGTSGLREVGRGSAVSKVIMLTGTPTTAINCAKKLVELPGCASSGLPDFYMFPQRFSRM